MTKMTERLLQVAIVLAILFYGWQFAVQTVVTIIERNNIIQQLQRQIGVCEQALQSKAQAKMD